MRKQVLPVLWLLLSAPVLADPPHHCAKDVLSHAEKLLDFHFGQDDRTEIDERVDVLEPIRNPAGKGLYDVLEVYGHIYKGTYRMRFIYAQKPDQCLLIGQEILEMTDF